MSSTISCNAGQPAYREMQTHILLTSIRPFPSTLHQGHRPSWVSGSGGEKNPCNNIYFWLEAKKFFHEGTRAWKDSRSSFQASASPTLVVNQRKIEGKLLKKANYRSLRRQKREMEGQSELCWMDLPFLAAVFGWFRAQFLLIMASLWCVKLCKNVMYSSFDHLIMHLSQGAYWKY